MLPIAILVLDSDVFGAWEFEMTETVTLLVHNRTPDAGVLERKNQSAAQKRQALASGKC